MLHTNKGFLLIDSLITVFITSLVCLLCYSIYTAMSNYDEGYNNFQEKSNQRLEKVFSNLGTCETCEVSDESD